MSDLDKELDEILDSMSVRGNIMQYSYENAKHQLKRLMVQGRIDELENQIKQEWNGMNQVLVARRIDELQAIINGDKEQ